MHNVASDLLGKRVSIQSCDEDGHWLEVVIGTVRGVACAEAWFSILLEVELRAYQEPSGRVHLWKLGHVELPARALISISTKPGTYQNPIAVILAD